MTVLQLKAELEMLYWPVTAARARGEAQGAQ
jgi:hypothetical protein